MSAIINLLEPASMVYGMMRQKLMTAMERCLDLSCILSRQLFWAVREHGPSRGFWGEALVSIYGVGVVGRQVVWQRCGLTVQPWCWRG